MSADAEPNHLLLDGPFTNDGLASLAGLDGLFGLSFFWHVSALTGAGLAGLADLPNLGFLGCEGKLCDDDAMRHIGAIPHLRMLMGQGTVASDEGFAALSRSQTIEYIWGRECPNLTGRGFTALSTMPALRGLAVSCKNVDDAALSDAAAVPGAQGAHADGRAGRRASATSAAASARGLVVHVLPRHDRCRDGAHRRPVEARRPTTRARRRSPIAAWRF